ncbi:MAG TPA: molybdenum cofactor synthesis domain-containing protein [Bacteroidales bacterium]|jgi:molybdenum cofactor synthesis domain-containing protein|nr:molybdenum cofactor synthesis domain-containing protein [Bacteroidales bacterium]
MNLPEEFRIIIITLSDRASKGEYKDLSGPRIREIISDWFKTTGWNFSVTNKLIPDDGELLSGLLISSLSDYNIIITTGGTGIGPRDITTETVAPLLNKEIPGIMEYIRIKYGADKPSALLSRGVAGIAGKSLIYTLPGSLKAVEEYMTEILKTLEHTILMQYGVDTHKKH